MRVKKGGLRDAPRGNQQVHALRWPPQQQLAQESNVVPPLLHCILRIPPIFRMSANATYSRVMND